MAKNPEIRINRERLMFVRSGLTVAVDLNVYQPGFEGLEPGASEIILSFHPSTKDHQHVFTLRELQILESFIGYAKKASADHGKVAAQWEMDIRTRVAFEQSRSAASDRDAVNVVWTEDEEWGKGL